jgi:hypothetical protein
MVRTSSFQSRTSSLAFTRGLRGGDYGGGTSRSNLLAATVVEGALQIYLQDLNSCEWKNPKGLCSYFYPLARDGSVRLTQRRRTEPSTSSTWGSSSWGLDFNCWIWRTSTHQGSTTDTFYSQDDPPFREKYSTQGSRAPCHVSFSFFSEFLGIRLAELLIDPQLESTIQTKARGLHSIWNVSVFWTGNLLRGVPEVDECDSPRSVTRRKRHATHNLDRFGPRGA